MLLDMKLSKFSLSSMSQSVTSTKPSPFGPAVSEQSLRSLKETAGSEPITSLACLALCGAEYGTEIEKQFCQQNGRPSPTTNFDAL